MHALLGTVVDSLSPCNCWLIKFPWQLAASACVLSQPVGTSQGKALSPEHQEVMGLEGEEQPAAAPTGGVQLLIALRSI